MNIAHYPEPWKRRITNLNPFKLLCRLDYSWKLLRDFFGFLIIMHLFGFVCIVVLLAEWKYKKRFLMDFTFQIHPGTCLRGRIKIISWTRDFYTALDVVKASAEIFSRENCRIFREMVKGRVDFLLFEVLIFYYIIFLKKRGWGDSFWEKCMVIFWTPPRDFFYLFISFFFISKKFLEQSITTWGLMVYRTKVRGGALKIFEAWIADYGLCVVMTM